MRVRYDFFPDREPEMLAFGANFARVLQDREDHFGLPDEIVAEFADRQRLFERCYERATTPATRTSLAVAEKNEARRGMESLARMMARQLNGSMLVDDSARQALGLTIRKPRTRHVRPPGAAPVVQVIAVDGHDVTLRLMDAERPRRARPDEAQAATIFYALGEEAPLSRRDWTWGMGTSKTLVRLRIRGDHPAGTAVWISAWWQNRRDEPGPASVPTRVELMRARLVVDAAQRVTHPLQALAGGAGRTAA